MNGFKLLTIEQFGQTIDLLDESRFCLERNGYVPKVSYIEGTQIGGRIVYADVSERIRIKARGKTRSDALQNFGELTEMVARSAEWRRRKNIHPILISAQLTGSSKLWQAALKGSRNGVSEIDASFNDQIEMFETFSFEISFERSGLWKKYATENESGVVFTNPVFVDEDHNSYNTAFTADLESELGVVAPFDVRIGFRNYFEYHGALLFAADSADIVTVNASSTASVTNATKTTPADSSANGGTVLRLTNFSDEAEFTLGFGGLSSNQRGSEGVQLFAKVRTVNSNADFLLRARPQFGDSTAPVLLPRDQQSPTVIALGTVHVRRNSQILIYIEQIGGNTLDGIEIEMVVALTMRGHLNRSIRIMSPEEGDFAIGSFESIGFACDPVQTAQPHAEEPDLIINTYGYSSGLVRYQGNIALNHAGQFVHILPFFVRNNSGWSNTGGQSDALTYWVIRANYSLILC